MPTGRCLFKFVTTGLQKNVLSVLKVGVEGKQGWLEGKTLRLKTTCHLYLYLERKFLKGHENNLVLCPGQPEIEAELG